MAQLLNDLHRYEQLATAQIALARKSDGLGFAASVAETTVRQKLGSDMIDAGFKAQDDCRSLF